MQLAPNDFTPVEPYFEELDEQEQTMFRSIWLLRDKLASLKIVVSENEQVAVSALLKVSIRANEPLQIQLFSLCTLLCRHVTEFANQLAVSKLAEGLVEPLHMSSDEAPPFLAYILALNDKHTTHGCIFASHLNSAVSESLEKGVRTGKTSLSINNLWILVRNKKIRAFFRTINGVQNIFRFVWRFCLTDQVAMAQTLYEALGICWLCLYDKENVQTAYKNRVIAITHAVLKHNTKEKCIRMSLLILEILLWHQTRETSADGRLRSVLYIDMSSSGMLKTFHALRKKNWEDGDITDALATLEQAVLNKIESMTTFAEYRNEVQNGNLEWSPIHTNVKFWKDNVKHFEENEFEILATLRGILFKDDADTSVAVACHDIGEILQHHPQGRKLLGIPALAGVKERMLELMSHSAAEVRHHALVAIQKVLVQKWEFIG